MSWYITAAHAFLAREACDSLPYVPATIHIVSSRNVDCVSRRMNSDNGDAMDIPI